MHFIRVFLVKAVPPGLPRLWLLHAVTCELIQFSWHRSKEKRHSPHLCNIYRFPDARSVQRLGVPSRRWSGGDGVGSGTWYKMISIALTSMEALVP